MDSDLIRQICSKHKVSLAVFWMKGNRNNPAVKRARAEVAYILVTQNMMRHHIVGEILNVDKGTITRMIEHHAKVNGLPNPVRKRKGIIDRIDGLIVQLERLKKDLELSQM